MTPQQVQTALRDRNLRIVAEETGLHYNTVASIGRGDTSNPSWETMRKLSEYLTRDLSA